LAGAKLQARLVVEVVAAVQSEDVKV